MEKQEVIQAAIEVAKGKGWNQTSVRAIAKKIQYSTIKIYSDFGSKEALLQEVQHQGFLLIREEYEKAIQIEETAEKKLVALTLAHYAFAIDQKEYYELMFQMGGTNCQVSDRDIMFRTSQPIRDLIFQIGGRVDKTLFFNWWVIAHGFVVVVGQDPLIPRAEAVDMLSDITQNFIKSIVS
ncbi:MAG: TetR/AcrR family transcriptional regulator [Bacteroidota bacterium]